MMADEQGRADSVTGSARPGASEASAGADASGSEAERSARGGAIGESGDVAQEPSGSAEPGDLRARLTDTWREFRRFARGVLGSDAYDKYVHHHRITGCTHPLMSEREFWRAKYREQDENPGARCC